MVNNTGTLADRAMLVSLSISVWTARRYDRKVSNEVADSHGTGYEAGRYNKNLLPVNSDSYKAVVQAAGTARTIHYANTLPWSDEGARILTTANFMPYMEKMRAARADFDHSLSEFMTAYPQLREYAKAYLNGLYVEEDYPAPDALPGKFGFSVRVLPLPVANDFRVKLTDTEVAAIRQQIEAGTSEAVTAAQADLWKRLYKAVGHMAERLTDAGTERKKFHDTLVENLRDLCDLLPRLNMTGDAQLASICDEARKKLAGYNAQDLRDSETLRRDVAREAEAIQSKMAAFMGSV